MWQGGKMGNPHLERTSSVGGFNVVADQYV